MAICGTDCSIEVAGDSNAEGHQFSIATSSQEFDTRAFGDGDYGSYVACAKNGTITVRTYEKIANCAPGDLANINCNIGGTNLEATNAVCTSVNGDVDAKGITEYSYSFRLTGDITSW